MENKNTNNFNYVNSNQSQSNGFKQPAGQAPKKTGSNSFAKSVVLPFATGILGAVLTIGVCFNVPSIRSKLINTTTYSNSGDSSASINYNNVNMDLVSLSNFSDTGIAVAQKVLPSVVGINVEYPINSIFSKTSSTAQGEGSGVIISEDGYILTNNHVISSTSSSSSSVFYEIGEATKLTVTLYNDDTEYPAKVIGTDEQTDLAVIKIDKTGLPAATLGDSDALQVGEWCMAIGNPLGMQSSVTTGSISALNREITDEYGTFTLIQTDTAINSGNSGGALVNSKGEVIGINNRKASGTGIEGLGFAIPINSTKSIYKDLIEFKKVIRPYIGIVGRNITQADIKVRPNEDLEIGIYVKSIEDFSPAEKAGLKVGDIIIKADDKTVKNMDELNVIKNKHKVNETMTLTVKRNGQEKTINVELKEQP